MSKVIHAQACGLQEKGWYHGWNIVAVCVLSQPPHFMEVQKDKLVESYSFHGKAYRVLNVGEFKMPNPAGLLGYG